MPDPVDPQVFLNLIEMTIDTMYEVEAMGNLLEHKGLITKEELLALAKDLKQQMPPFAKPAFPRNATSLLQPFTETENKVIEGIMEIILQSGLSSQHAQALLKRTITLLKWGEQTASKMSH